MATFLNWNQTAIIREAATAAVNQAHAKVEKIDAAVKTDDSETGRESAIDQLMSAVGLLKAVAGASSVVTVDYTEKRKLES